MTTIEGLASLRDRWDALVASQPSPDPLRRSGSLTAWWRAFGAPSGRRTARILLAMDGPRLLGAAPMMVERLRGGLLLLRHLGDSAHWCDPDLLVRPEAPGARLALARAIAEMHCDLVVLEDLAEDSPTIDVLAAAVPEIRIMPQRVNRHRLRTLHPPPLEASREDARGRMRAAGQAGHSLATSTLDHPAEIGVALDDARVLMDQPLRSRVGSSPDDHAAGNRYLRETLAGLAPGHVVMTRVHVDGDLAAFDLAFREGPGAMILQSGRNPDAAVAGTGWMSALAMIDRLTALGATEVDVGRAVEPDGREIASPPERSLITAALPHGTRGMAALQLWRARPTILAGGDRVRLIALRARDASSRGRRRSRGGHARTE